MHREPSTPHAHHGQGPFDRRPGPDGTGPRPSPGVLAWWPLLVYGPWLVASLSVLRAALHRRRAVHSWAVVLLFSHIAMVL